MTNEDEIFINPDSSDDDSNIISVEQIKKEELTEDLSDASYQNSLINPNSVATDLGVNVYQYPNTINECNHASITVGDLHGNAVKLLHVLLREGIVEFEGNEENAKVQYQAFVDLYGDTDSLLSEMLLKHKYEDQVERAENLINKINECKDGKALIELADDNSNFFNYTQADLMNKNLEQQKKYFTSKLTIVKNTKNQMLSGIKSKIEEIRLKVNDIAPKFDAILANLKPCENSNNVLVRLIGDELADRGANDYFTLKLLQFLSRNDIPYVINTSNHSDAFIQTYENNWSLVHSIEGSQCPSIHHFLAMRREIRNESGNESGNEFDNDIDQIIKDYKSHLKVIDYSLSDEGISIFTHAPIAFNRIQFLAEKLGITYVDSSKEALADTIDKINQTINVKYVAKNKLHELTDIKIDGVQDAKNLRKALSDKQAMEWPLVDILWHRWTNELEEIEGLRPNEVNGFSVRYVHGHDDFQSQKDHVCNLDTDLGKRGVAETSRLIDNNQIEKSKQYKVLQSNEQSMTPGLQLYLDIQQLNKMHKAALVQYKKIAKFKQGGKEAMSAFITELFAHAEDVTDENKKDKQNAFKKVLDSKRFVLTEDEKNNLFDYAEKMKSLIKLSDELSQGGKAITYQQKNSFSEAISNEGDAKKKIGSPAKLLKKAVLKAKSDDNADFQLKDAALKAMTALFNSNIENELKDSLRYQLNSYINNPEQDIPTFGDVSQDKALLQSLEIFTGVATIVKARKDALDVDSKEAKATVTLMDSALKAIDEIEKSAQQDSLVENHHNKPRVAEAASRQMKLNVVNLALSPKKTDFRKAVNQDIQKLKSQARTTAVVNSLKVFAGAALIAAGLGLTVASAATGIGAVAVPAVLAVTFFSGAGFIHSGLSGLFSPPPAKTSAIDGFFKQATHSENQPADTQERVSDENTPLLVT